jgi:hypothetical protein
MHDRKNSRVFYCSEFRLVHELSTIFSSPSILSSGAAYPLHHFPNKSRQDDFTHHKEPGKHKSASKFPSIISAMIKEDVECGFALPLPIEILPHILNASLAPLGCQEQSTINE